MNGHLRPLLSILVVDDPDTAESTVDLLTLYGYHVRAASCGADALREATVNTPDVVLLDIGLPRMNGWELAGRLRDIAAPGKQPIIVAVTGYGQDDAYHKSHLAGCDLHLVKPVDPHILVGHLKQFREALETGH